MPGPTTAFLRRHCELLDEFKQRHCPGTSKWNKIEHRLFSHITHSWRGRPLTSHEVVIETIAATRTRAGLRVEAHLDPGDYPTGIAISKDRFAALPLVRHEVHGQWNYTLLPESSTPQTLPTSVSAYKRTWPWQDFREAGVCHRAPVTLRHG